APPPRPPARPGPERGRRGPRERRRPAAARRGGRCAVRRGRDGLRALRGARRGARLLGHRPAGHRPVPARHGRRVQPPVPPAGAPGPDLRADAAGRRRPPLAGAAARALPLRGRRLRHHGQIRTGLPPAGARLRRRRPARPGSVVDGHSGPVLRRRGPPPASV
ncbi:MAG: hypothetical protein AVDCRST_MAG79-3212, partial [uncultured Thermoleophilia bacterium]